MARMTGLLWYPGGAILGPFRDWFGAILRSIYDRNGYPFEIMIKNYPAETGGLRAPGARSGGSNETPDVGGAERAR